MATPICVIKIDIQRVSAGVNNEWAMWQKTFEDRLPDYHVFVIPLTPNYEQLQDAFEFQVFYEKDFTEIKYEELKQIIEGSILNKNQP